MFCTSNLFISCCVSGLDMSGQGARVAVHLCGNKLCFGPCSQRLRRGAFQLWPFVVLVCNPLDLPVVRAATTTAIVVHPLDLTAFATPIHSVASLPCAFVTLPAIPLQKTG